MKNKYLALFMALIMCFSFAIGSFAAVDGSQVTPPEMVVPTTQDTVDKVVDGVVDSELGDQMGEVGDQVMDGFYEGNSFMQRIYDLLETIKIALANVINTLFKMMNIGTDGSLLG